MFNNNNNNYIYLKSTIQQVQKTLKAVSLSKVNIITA